MKISNLYYIILFLATLISCTKNDYFQDTGIHDPKFNGNVLQYLESKGAKPIDPFDTLLTVIKLAGMEEAFKNDRLTFFAAPDPSISKTIAVLNVNLYLSGQDTITSLDEIKPIVWKYFLSQYILKEDLGLIDFPQLDTLALDAFSGQLYQTYNQDEPLNVGVIYHDLINEESILKYKGPRQIMISYIPDFTKPKNNWVNTFIASSNIQPTNGRVHVINYNKHFFGFNPYRFVAMAKELGIDYK